MPEEKICYSVWFRDSVSGDEWHLAGKPWPNGGVRACFDRYEADNLRRLTQLNFVLADVELKAIKIVSTPTANCIVCTSSEQFEVRKLPKPKHPEGD